MSALEPQYTLFDNLQEMLSSKSIGRILGRHISDVSSWPFVSSNGFSGNQLFHVEADGQKLVMKHLRPALDWLSIGTCDHLCRSVRVWQYGILDHIRPYMEHEILAACQDGDDFFILMQDISSGLISFQQEKTPQLIHPMLDALARIHAMFWEDENLLAPELGLCNSRKLISSFWPTHWHQFQSDIVETFKQGWDALFDLVEPDVREIVHSLMETPEPLYDALSNYPSTFVHGDYRLDNLAFFPATNKLVVFDWQNAGFLPATIGMCWFVMSGGVFHRQEEYVHYYQQRLIHYLGERFAPDIWQPMLDLGCLVDVLRKGNWHALFSVIGDDEEGKAYMRGSVDSYNDLVRRGVAWL